MKSSVLTSSAVWRSAGILHEAFALAILAAIAALLSAWLAPERAAADRPERVVPELTIAEVQQLNLPLVWVDARHAAAFEADHIPGAVRLNEAQWEELFPGFLAAWTPDCVVIVYCDGDTCDASREVAVRIGRELNFGRVVVLKNGWQAWREAHRG